MTRARNLAGLGTVTAQPTTTTPVHLGPLGVGTFARIYGTWEHDQINSVSIGTTQLQISGITTGLNVSGIITSQNGIIVSGVSTFLGSQSGLNVTGVATFAGNVSIAGTLTYEDVTDIDSVGIITARQLINAQGQVHVGTGVSIKAGGLNVTAGVSTFAANINANGNIVGDDSTNISGIASVTATTYYGSGASLTGIDATTVKDSNSVTRLAGTTSGVVISGTTSGLSVVGVATVASDVSIADKIIHTGDTNTSLRFPAADTITAETGGSERIRITSAGLVGINCTPNKQLEVKGTDVAFRLLSTVATGRIGMEFYDTSAQKGYFGYASSSNDEMSIQQNEAADLWFYVNGAERLRIKSDGNVNLNNDINVVGITTLKGKVGLDTTGALNLPQGTTSERPSDASSSTPYIRWNTTNSALEVYNGSNWVEIITDYFPTGSTFFN